VAYACQNVIPCGSVENVVSSLRYNEPTFFFFTVIKHHFIVHDVTSHCNIHFFEDHIFYLLE